MSNKKFKLGDRIKTEHKEGIIIAFFDREYIIKDLKSKTFDCDNDTIREWKMYKMGITNKDYWNDISFYADIKLVKGLVDY